LENDIDGVPWRDEIVSRRPFIENGDYLCPKPGWGVDVIAGLRDPPKSYVVSAEPTADGACSACRLAGRLRSHDEGAAGSRARAS